MTIDLSAIGGSALTDARIRVPEQRRLEEIGRGIPVTYVPARNTIFLAYALGLAEATAAKAIVIAANQVDYSGYPDCRPEYYAAFREVARLGTKRGAEGDVIEIHTPLIRMSKADIVRKGEEHAVEGGDFTRMGVDATVKKILRLAGDLQSDARGIRNLCWTGGEPLLQGESIARAIERLPETFVHSIETDGEIDLSTFDALVPDERASGRVRYVMDVKCPGSGMVANKAHANLERLREHDEAKFVLLDRADYAFARSVLSKVDTRARTVLFSPATPAHQVSHGLDPGQLASWILDERLPVRLQLQLHKLIWPGRARGI